MSSFLQPQLAFATAPSKDSLEFAFFLTFLTCGPNDSDLSNVTPRNLGSGL